MTTGKFRSDTVRVAAALTVAGAHEKESGETHWGLTVLVQARADSGSDQTAVVEVVRDDEVLSRVWGSCLRLCGLPMGWMWV